MQAIRISETLAPRDPRVRIDRRYCARCGANCQTAFVLSLKGIVNGDLHFCKFCVRRIGERLDAGSDSLLTATVTGGIFDGA